MTKKSDGRLQRDAAKKKRDNVWDDLAAIHIHNARALISPYTLCSQFETRLDIKAFVPDMERFDRFNNTLANDILRLSTDLNEINIQHKGKTGGLKTPDEAWLSVALGEKYTAWAQSFEGPVMRTLGQLTELWDEAQRAFFVVHPEKLEELKAEEAARAAAQTPAGTPAGTPAAVAATPAVSLSV